MKHLDALQARAKALNGNVVLPTQSMKSKITTNSKEAYITSESNNLKFKKRPYSEEKVIKYFKENIYEYSYEYGHIRLRKKVDSTDKWNVELDGSAFKINSI